MERAHKKIIILTVLAALLFNYPWPEIFSTERMIFGIPVLYVFLFGTWAGLIFFIRHYVDLAPDGSDDASGITKMIKQPKRKNAAK